MQRLATSLVPLALLSACPTETTDPPGNDGADDDSGSASMTTTLDADATADDDGSTGTADDTTSATLTSSGTTEGADTTDTGDAECGPAAACGELAPVGWFGPAIYARVLGGGPAPDCPESFSALGPSVLEGWNDPGPAICECSCELSTPLTCSSYAYSHNTASCNTYNLYTPVTTMCVNANLTGWTQFYSNAQNFPTCMQESSETFPPPVWDAQIRSCKLAEDATGQACGEGGTCLPTAPEGFESGLCIYKDGDNECPAGAYANKTLFHANFDDTRECSNCSCGSATATCTAPLQVFEGTDCEGAPLAEIAPNSACTQVTGGSVAMASDDDGGCPVSSPAEPMGAIMPTGPFTFCCQ
jgi:hypothetical protein